MIIAEYIWLDGHQKFRSKFRSIQNQNEILEEPWNYDGSSTYQANTESSEIFLHPVKIVNNPFIDNGLLVLCDTYLDFHCEKPTISNHRYEALKISEKYKEFNPTFGFEQEYFITIWENGKHVIEHFKDNQIPSEQGDYYCGIHPYMILHRNLTLEHYKICMKADLTISGINAEVTPSQWEFQIGPVTGIDAGDQLMIGRYILERVAEKYGKGIEWNPKPLANPWNGSGLHTNFSTVKTMNKETGYNSIMKAIENASKNHEEDLKYYGDNTKRLNGKCETSDKNVFSYGIADRKASIRIPTSVVLKGYGYIEDRRPASDADPYLIIQRIIPSFCV